MRDEYAVFLHQRLLVLVRVDAVCHDARISAAEEAKLLIRVAVMLRAGTQLPDPRDLGVVFRQMALHGYAVFCLQPRKAVHQIVCAGGDKARRQNRLHGPVCFLSLAEPPFRVPQGLIGRDLAQIDRRVAVHVDLADIARQPRLVQLLHEKLRSGYVDGGENSCARGRAVQQVVHEAAVGPVRVLQFLIFGFLWEGIGIQPFQQLHIHTETAEGKLRRMDMQIGHARQDQLNGRGYPDWGGLDANKRIAGYCLWSWNDYARGSASVTLGSGAVDIDRFGKYSAYWLETMQPARDPQYGPKVFVASTNSPDSSLDVDVFSNCDSVKFYRNGKFVGEQTREEALKACPHIGEKGGSPIFRFSLSGYEAGELKAEAYLDGKLVKTHAVSTPGNPARVVVEPDLKGIAPVADGSDLIPVHVKVVDAEGTVVPGFKGNVRVGVEGAGTLVGEKMPRIRVENQQPDGGIGFFFAKTGNSPGKLILKASSDGLEAGEAVVESLPFTGRFVPGQEPRWTRSEADLEDKAELFLNLAAGCPVTVSSAQEQNPAAAVTDEDEGSRWAASDGSFPQTVEIDMKAPASMSAVEIIWENPLAYVFRLETSGDGKTWFPAAEGKAVQGRSLSPVRTHARYVRVVVTGVEGEAGWASIREIRVRPLGEGEELSPGEPVPNADVVCLTASAPSEPDRGTDKLRDGETVIGSGWLSASSECPQSVTMEFKSPQTLTGSRIYWEKDSSQYTYDMEVSSDGKNWNKVMDQRQVAGQYFKPEFFPVPVKNVRYVRVTLTQVNSGAGVNKIGMAEWILYRQPGI